VEYLDQPFEVSVGSGRRPTPTTFEHLRKYSALELAYLKLSSQFDITNINSILEQTANLYISNEISRVIAQVIGKLDPGFVTIEGTAEGALHVYLAAAAAALEVNATLLEGSALIGKVQIDGLPKTYKSKAFHVNTSPTSDIIAADGTKSHYICSIMFTVAAENDVTLKDETEDLSGAMNLGASGEPMGLTHNFGQAPLVCNAGKKFQFGLSQAQYVSGVVTYYSE